MGKRNQLNTRPPSRTHLHLCSAVVFSSVYLINPRRACAARVTVVVLCVCVCLSAHAILAVRAIKRITKDTIVLNVRFAAILKWCFSLNCLIQKLEHFYLPRQGRPSLVDAYSAMRCFVYSPLHVCLRVKHCV